MDPGIYLNIFTVTFDDEPVILMISSRSNVPHLREFRKTLQARPLQADVYQIEGQIYGYGKDQALLKEWGFTPKSIQIGRFPSLAARLILEGFVASLVEAGYTYRWSKQGATVYQLSTPLLRHETGVVLYRGFELQSLFLNDPETNTLVYAVVIDATFTYRGLADEPLRPDAIVAQFGTAALDALLTAQGDLAVLGKINLEVARQRLLKQTLPFVHQRGVFTLSCGILASLSLDPMRVILIGDEEGT